jgi:hypothetical protein
MRTFKVKNYGKHYRFCQIPQYDIFGLRFKQWVNNFQQCKYYRAAAGFDTTRNIALNAR